MKLDLTFDIKAVFLVEKKILLYILFETENKKLSTFFFLIILLINKLLKKLICNQFCEKVNFCALVQLDEF